MMIKSEKQKQEQQRQNGVESSNRQPNNSLVILPPNIETADQNNAPGLGAHSTSSSVSGDHQPHQSSSSFANGHAYPLPFGRSPSVGSKPDLDYLAQLLKDKKQLSAFPNVFSHVERLIDEEINRVRVAIFQCEFTREPLQLPQGIGEITVHQKKIYVPVQQYPEYNFVGRILGPRGMTAKQLESETGCKIMVRGKGSMRDKKKEEANRGKPNWEHLSEELHVIIQCEDTENRAQLKMERAEEEVNKLLVPAPEGEDELKKKQLMELAIINGTFRQSTSSSTPNTSTTISTSQNGGKGITSLLQFDPHLLGYPATTPLSAGSAGLAGTPLLIMPSAASLAAFKSNSIGTIAAAQQPIAALNNSLAAAQALALQQLTSPNTASLDYQQQLIALGQLQQHSQQQQLQQQQQIDSAHLSAALFQQQQMALAALQQQQQFGADFAAGGYSIDGARNAAGGENIADALMQMPAATGGHILSGQRRFVGHMRDGAHPYNGGK